MMVPLSKVIAMEVEISVWMCMFGDCVWISGRESAYNAGAAGDSGSIPKVRKIPWRRAWQPTPVSLPGESHRQRSLESHSP